MNFLKEFAAEHDKEVLKIHKLIDKLANEFSSLDVIEEDLNEIRDKQGEDSYILHKTATIPSDRSKKQKIPYIFWLS